MFDDIGKAVQVHSLKFYHCLHGEVYVAVDQAVHQNSSLRDVFETHCRALAKLFRDNNYNYAIGMNKVYVSTTVNRDGTPYANAVQTVDSFKLLKDGYCMVVLDVRHLYRTVGETSKKASVK